MSHRTRSLALALIVLTCAGSALAQGFQPVAGKEDPLFALAAEHHLIDGFGTNPQVAVFSPIGLVPDDATTTLEYFSGGYRYLAIDGGGYIKLGLGAGTDLPLGAVLGVACLQVRDTRSDGEVKLAMWAFEQPVNPGTTPFVDMVADWQTSGEAWDSGYTSVCIIPAITLTAYADLDGDLTQGRISHAFGVDFDGPTGAGLAAGAISVLWARQVSPAPASATFGDVPVGAFGFQHVEALAASGITAGCGGGNFCPNAPLTRVQMAVFLAKALGLHFPL